MAYDTDRLYEQSLEAIKKHGLYFVSDVISCLPCQKSTFYDHFPEGSEKSNDIKKELDKNRINAKVELRKKWLKSNNGTMQMGLMKLLSEDEELRKLAMEYHQHGGEIGVRKIERRIVDPDDE